MLTGDRAAGRRCILEQAQQLFFEHGYHGVSVRDIVQACGFSNAALYYHFGSKQNLFVEVIKEHVAMVAGQMQEEGAGSGSCRERLGRMAEVFAQVLLASHSGIQLLFRDLMQRDGEEIQHLLPNARGQVPSLFAKVLEAGIAAGEVRPVDAHRIGVLLLGMINSLAARRMFDQVAETLTEDIDLAISTLFEGIST